MAWPPPTLPINFTDSTPQQTTHPDQHNKLSQAINDTVAEMGSNPSGADATVQARLDRMESETGLKGCRFYGTGQTCPGGTTTTIQAQIVAWDSTPPFATVGSGNIRIQGAGVYAIHCMLSGQSTPGATCVATITSSGQGNIGIAQLVIPGPRNFLSVSAVMSLADQDVVGVDLFVGGASAINFVPNFTIARIFKM